MMGFSFDLLGVLFRLDSKLSRLCRHVCIFHCTCAEVYSHRNLYSTLFSPPTETSSMGVILL